MPIKKSLKRPGRVLCAISGGVDSAVAAALLIKAGYEVTGAFIKCYSDDADTCLPAGRRGFYADDPSHSTGHGADNADVNRGQSCWIDERRDAMRVAAKLGVKLLTFDFEKEYRRFVVNYLFREYKDGRTPNPDVICNQRVKIPLLLREAVRLGFDYVATGHYARIVTRTIEHLNTGTREHLNTGTLEPRTKPEGALKLVNHFRAETPTAFFVTSVWPQIGLVRGRHLNTGTLDGQAKRYKLLEAVDKNKDQSYFLHQLKQPHLRRLLFPLGDLTKNEVRRLARQWHLPVADKEESMGICFIGERKMGEFLGQRLKDKPGDIISVHGKKLGRHRGLFFYTIGQRQGLGLGGGIPYFVVGKDLKRNRLIVARGENHSSLFKRSCLVRKAHWIAGQPPKFPLKCEVRLRHRQPLQECLVTRIQANKMRISANQGLCYRVVFDKPQRAVTPGQFAVFYQKGECLGGGTIVM